MTPGWLYCFDWNITLCLIIRVAEKTDQVFQFSTARSHSFRQLKRLRDLQSPPLFLFLTEIYTIQGNSNGRPCYLPFLYDSQWFHSCTGIGREDGHLWCATTFDYGKDENWGFCPVKSEWTLCLLHLSAHWNPSISLSFFSAMSTPVSSYCVLCSDWLLVSLPRSQAAAVRHSGILTRWRTAVTSLTSTLRCHGARHGSVASSRGQTCWASPSCMSRPILMVTSVWRRCSHLWKLLK